ncbi:MAG: membrane lipoprotein lipid attachment site-containing protein [Ignavibacteria bacterium]|nr:membrane lipoprotein lipid attachment site-containing protein [Ignavibacteria bacterium]
MRKILILLFFLAVLSGCKVETNFSYKGPEEIAGVYKVFMGKIDSLAIYIVDGDLIRREIYSDFIFGGNAQRYTFIPQNEIWIDNAIPIREYTTTLKHEINEMILMRDKGMNYIAAHDSSLMLEVKLRMQFRKEALEHEKKLPEVSPTDTDSVKQIPSLPDKIKLENIYLEKREDKENPFSIWVVDGDKVRREIYPDFGFNGDWYDYNFIPENEIWFDGNISCDQYIYLIEEEKTSTVLTKSGVEYKNAEEKTDIKIKELRAKMYNELIRKFVKIDRTKPLYKD